MIDGTSQRRTTLTANVEEVVKFHQEIQSVSVLVQGGTVYYKTDSTILGANDNTTNFLDDAASTTNIYRKTFFSELHLFTTDSNVVVEWDLA
jgi:hypothetical protein